MALGIGASGASGMQILLTYFPATFFFFVVVVLVALENDWLHCSLDNFLPYFISEREEEKEGETR